MATIKIVSNPYKKTLDYFRFVEGTGQWEKIKYEENVNSRLFKEGIKRGFFTFVVKKIVDILVEDYWDHSTPIELVFEGTEDEYKELQYVCENGDLSSKIILKKSKVYLDDARDILPDIREIFKAIEGLISEFASGRENINDEIKKFSDAADDTIPICVLGNYSSGKSTFINALIGCEILPSGDRPVTGKIYKIIRSKYDDRAYIDFRYLNRDIKLRLADNRYKFLNEPGDGEVIRKIEELLNEDEKISIIQKVNKVVNYLTNFRDEKNEISDILTITVPFFGGLWKLSENEFMIFDTPGSNTASYEKHLMVLKTALLSLSNGLPIYVSDSKSLDSKDNEELYKIIRELKELDDRFTMIVVNKADDANLPKSYFTQENIDDILNLTIPKKLYSEGIFYVSSIMGLGAKTNGEFIDDHYAEIYEGAEQKYKNPENRFYKMLYRYNIVPEQLTGRLIEDAEQCENVLWANSGLFSIEREIQTFANKYTYYNKCQQSNLFLKKLITITEEEIISKSEQVSVSVDTLTQNLEKGKVELVNRINTRTAELKDEYLAGYDPYLTERVGEIKQSHIYDGIENEEDEISEKYAVQNEYDKKKDEVDKAHAHITQNLWLNVKKAFKEFKLASFKEIGTDLIEDIRAHDAKESILIDAEDNIKNRTSSELLGIVKQRFYVLGKDVGNVLFEKSKEYWESCSDKMKCELINIISDSKDLDNSKKAEISNIIISFNNVQFVNTTDEIFTMSNFERKVSRLTRRSNLDISKLEKKFNELMFRTIDDCRDKMKITHENNFVIWHENLTRTIKNNIVEYSPKLLALSNTIKDEKQQIIDLQSKIEILNNYSEKVRQMMDWKVD